MRFRNPLYLMLLFVLAYPLALFAQQAAPLELPPQSSTFDWVPIAVNMITALQIVLIPAVIGFVKMKLTSIPPLVTMALVSILAILSDALLSYVAHGNFSLIRGALITACAVFLRELVKALQNAGTFTFLGIRPRTNSN